MAGLPNSGVIVSAVNPKVGFQLQPFNTTTGGTSKNIDLVVNGDTSTVTTLGLATPGQYQTLNVLNLAANGTSSYAMTLLFSDGSSDSVTASSAGGNTVTDWVSGTTNLAFKGIGRINRCDGRRLLRRRHQSQPPGAGLQPVLRRSGQDPHRHHLQADVRQYPGYPGRLRHQLSAPASMSIPTTSW